MHALWSNSNATQLPSTTNRTTITKDRPHQLLDDMLPTMNTGDIVLMCCVSVMRGSVRVGEGGNFNHVAIVIKDPLVGAPCLWETFDNRGMSGPEFTFISRYVYRNKYVCMYLGIIRISTGKNFMFRKYCIYTDPPFFTNMYICMPGQLAEVVWLAECRQIDRTV